MAQRQGPGRPLFNPPNIESKGNIDIPKEALEPVVIDLLRDRDEEIAEAFKELPKNVRDTYISTVKKALFTLEARQTAPGLINYGQDEYQDLAGVQVTLSLNPQDWKNPSKYVQDTLKNWIKGVFQWQDFERQIEKELIQSFMVGDAESRLNSFQPDLNFSREGVESKGSVRLLEAKDVSGRESLRKLVVKGGRGVDGIEHYRELAGAVNDWVGFSQVITLRRGALDQVKDKYYQAIALEALYKGDPNWDLTENTEKDPDFQPDVKQATQKLQSVISDSSTPDELKEILTDFNNNGNFRDNFNTELFKVGNQSVSLRDIQNSVFQISDYKDGLNYYTASHFLQNITNDRQKFGTPATAAWADLIKSNASELGFSGPNAVDLILEHIKGEKLGDVVSNKILPAAFLKTSIEGVTKKDFHLFRSYYEGFRKKSSNAHSAMLTDLSAKMRRGSKNYIDSILATIPDPVEKEAARKRLYAGNFYRSFLQGMNDYKSMQEFFDELQDGNVIKTYFILGKLSNVLPPQVQEIKKKIDSIPIPGSKYKLGDIVGADGVFAHYKESLAQAFGIAGNPTSRRTLLGIFPNTTFLYAPDFRPEEVFLKIGSNKDFTIELFHSKRTYELYKNISSRFKQQFSSMSLAQIKVLARDLEGLPEVIEGINKFADYLDSLGRLNNVNNLHRAFGDIYRTFKKLGHLNFLDEGDHLALAPYKEALKSLFNYFKELEKKGVDPDDFLSVALYLSNNKGLVKDGKLLRFLPFLNYVNTRLNHAQTVIFQFVENKLLYQFIKKDGVFYNKLFGWLWKRFNPDYGPYKLVHQTFFGVPGSGKLPLAKRFILKLKTALRPLLRFKIFSKIAVVVKRLLPYLKKMLLAIPVEGWVSYLALWVGGSIDSMLKGLWGIVRGDFKRFFREMGNVVDKLLVKPAKGIGKLFTYIILSCLGSCMVLVTLFVAIIIGVGVLGQQYREAATGGLLGPLDSEHPITYGTDGSACYYEPDNINVLSGYVNHPLSVSNVTLTGQCPFALRGARPHMALDYGVPEGTPLLLPISGCGTVQLVDFTGYNGGFGNYIRVSFNHAGNRYLAYFAHLFDGSAVVSSGDQVCNGDRLASTGGASGNKGNSTGAHLHFEVRIIEGGNAHKLNPCSFLTCPTFCGEATEAGVFCVNQ